MAWTYLLRGDSGRYYIGSTTHLERRLEEHRRVQTHTTGAWVEISNWSRQRNWRRRLKRVRWGGT